VGYPLGIVRHTSTRDSYASLVTLKLSLLKTLHDQNHFTKTSIINRKKKIQFMLLDFDENIEV
jgi:hypothetical protein